ncbi:hypothetical protein U1Q18_037366, partial [Sarracenia purpurea var. burkii]
GLGEGILVIIGNGNTLMRGEHCCVVVRSGDGNRRGDGHGRLQSVWEGGEVGCRWVKG